MKIITNHKLIRNRTKIGTWSTTAALALIIIGMVFMFQENMMVYSSAAVVLGFIAMQIGVFMGARWGGKVKPHAQIEAALKGLDNRYTLYNYMTAAPHLLIGPAGVYQFITYHQAGTFTYDETKKRWKQKGGNAYLKMFAQEGLGRPDLDIEAFSTDLEKYLKKTVPDLQPQITHEPILLFLSEKATVDAKNAPAATLTPDKVKDYIRKRTKNQPVDMVLIEQLVEALPQDSIE